MHFLLTICRYAIEAVIKVNINSGLLQLESFDIVGHYFYNLGQNRLGHPARPQSVGFG